MKKMIALSISIYILAGCASNTVAVPKGGKSLRGKTITIIHKDFPKRPFIKTDAVEVGEAIGGVIGGIIMGSAQGKLYEGVTYQNPSEIIANNLINDITSRYSMRYIPNAKKVSSNKNLNILNSNPNSNKEKSYKEQYNTDYLLNVDTPTWRMYYSTMFIDNASFDMSNNIEIIDTKTEKPIAQVSCTYEKKWEDKIPKYKDIFANNHQFIKNYTQKAIDACIAKAKKEMLK